LEQQTEPKKLPTQCQYQKIERFIETAKTDPRNPFNKTPEQ
jgi:hypothetical protein